MSAFSASFSLAGKRALVTGCGRGIGQAMAVGLPEAGTDIIGVSVSLAPGPPSYWPPTTPNGRPA